jgi:hypothetical protein
MDPMLLAAVAVVAILAISYLTQLLFKKTAPKPGSGVCRVGHRTRSQTRVALELMAAAGSLL